MTLALARGSPTLAMCQPPPSMPPTPACGGNGPGPTGAVGDTVVTHGGLTLDEVVVPFVTIGRR